MLNMKQDKLKRSACSLGVAAAFLLASGGVFAAAVTVDLCATTGSLTLPAFTPPSTPTTLTVPVFGYVLGDCSTTASAAAPGGPTIVVTAGDVVTVNLHNALAAPSGLLFQGQGLVTDTVGAPAGTAAAPANKSYSFTATNPGTFLYEAALLPNTEYQTAMGLYGALIVRPAGVPARTDVGALVTNGSASVADAAAVAADVGASVSGTGIAPGTRIVAVVAGVSFTMSAAATANGDAAGVNVTPAMAYGPAATTFNNEAVLVLSEIDPALNSSAAPATFDMRDYAPRYFLINGKSYPNTDLIASAAGNKLLLRYVNAGAKHHSMAVLGLRQNFVAKDGGTLPTLNHNVAAETLAPGQTGDAIVTLPAVTGDSKFAIYDASLQLRNSNVPGFGGMLTFVSAGAASTTDTTGPVASAVTLTPNKTNGSVGVGLAASISDAASNVTAVEYFIDATGGTGTAMAGSFGTPTVQATATISVAALAGLSSGSHAIYVRAQDSATPPNWGAFSSATLNLDKAGPVSNGLTLTPNPSNGLVTVALTATANDSATGNSNVASAQYRIDGGATPVTMTVNAAAPVASLSATIPSGLAVGSHTVEVRSTDALGNTGAWTTATTLTVIASGPSTSNVSATPNPNNGTRPLSSNNPVVRIAATMASTGSIVAGAEGFFDTAPASAATRGFSFVPSDGIWNAASETGFADVPLTTIRTLANGVHTIYVRGKDATGNWGNTATGTLTIDTTAPAISAASLSANAILAPAAGTTTLNVTATDVGTGIASAQYWIDGSATTAPANATTFTGASATISVSGLAAGSHNVRVRVRDAATNWSAISSVPLYVMQAANDNRTIGANGNTGTQTSNQTSVLANDQPANVATRTAAIASALTKIAGAGGATVTITCPTSATPNAINAICADGTFRVNLTAVGGTNALRTASKVGTYRFTYTETLNGVTTAPATVTMTVN